MAAVPPLSAVHMQQRQFGIDTVRKALDSLGVSFRT